MLGREGTAARLQAHLDKKRPDHVSVLGPALYGKSVLLRELARRYAPGRPGYLTSTYLNLRIRTPETDGQLRERVAQGLTESFRETWSEGADLLAFEDVELEERLRLVGQELASTEEWVLLILDGFDEVLANPGITRSVWDGMMEVASKPVLRFVTGSRRPLRELCRTEEARTANFWEIFHDSPVVVGCFEEEDWPALLEPFERADIEIGEAARTAIERWTGRIPVLVIALLESLWRETVAGDGISADQIDSLAPRLMKRRRQLLLALWEDCSAEMKTDLTDLAQRSLRARDVPAGRLLKLERRGFVRQRGKRLEHATELMKAIASEEASGVGGLNRLFGDQERFAQNTRMLLELRLAQVPVVDKALHGFVEQAIRNLQPEPRHALVWVRSIVDRALDLVWKRELGDGSTLPESWISEWQRAGFQRLPDDGHGRLPRERGRQLGTLRFATGSGVRGQSIRRLTRDVTRPTVLLIDHLHEVGNFGQHQGDPVELDFAAAVCLTAITLCVSLGRDLDPALRPEAAG
jgi:hypothetical protein